MPETKTRITILLPAHNEEKSVRACIESCLQQTRKPDEIIVINDGSTDSTPEILKSFGKKIRAINVYPASGTKSKAQEKGIPHITGDIFITTDADTLLEKHLVERIEEDFTDPKVAAVGGYVKSLKVNWLTGCRAYDYCVGQTIHKRAQDILDFMLVIPGAVGAFRTDIFRKYLPFDHDTVTEDLDLTYRLHKLGMKIKYDMDAIVYTQDPSDMYSYINQMRRWLGGGWQNLRKHLGTDMLEDPRRVLELSLIYIEGLAFSTLLFLVPLLNIALAAQIMLMVFIVLCIQGIYASMKERRIDLLVTPLFYIFIMYINAWVFLEQFVKEIIIRKKTDTWFFANRVNIDEGMRK